MGTTNSIVIMQNATFTGNITHSELVKAGNYNGKVVSNDFVSLTIAVDDSQKNSIRVKASDSNGLLKAHQNGEVLKGLRVVINGIIDLAKLSECSHYTADGIHKTRKNPEITLTRAYIERMSSKKEEPAKVIQPELVK